jgi:para-nitrobenzyl esterase
VSTLAGERRDRGDRVETPDKKLGVAVRTYWTQFAKTSDPNTQGLPDWPVYDPPSDQCFELGRRIGVRPVTPRLQVLEKIMKQVLTETAN